MVGGGNIHRRVGVVDDAPTGISSNNVFSALGSLRRKKNKEDGSSKKGSAKPKEPEPVVIYVPKPLTDQKWGDMDVDDDDDDNYYKTTAPILSSWGPSDDTQDTPVESESEDDCLDLGDVDIDEEHEPEPDVQAQAEPVVKMPLVHLPPKEAERQLSKKELKKKELAELDAVLAELGIETDGQDESHGAQEKKELNGDADKKESVAPAGESKNARKKKKKSKDQEQPNGLHTNNGPDESAAGSEQAEEHELAALDIKERLKKVASMKKKKSSKEMDSTARAAATEASARSARLAAAKKKEKNHYNQQPVR